MVVALFRALEVPDVKPVAVPVQLVNTPLAGVPNAGVIKVGDVPNTKAPEPVSSLITAFSCAEVADAKLEIKGVCHVAVVPAVAVKT